MNKCEELIGLLRNSNNIEEIHSLSLDISDLNCENGLNAIMSKISQSLTTNYRGTLFYSCSVYDCSDYFLQLISNVISESYESTIEIYNLIIENIDYKKIKKQDLEDAIKLLENSNSKTDHHEIIEEIINFLKENCNV